VGVEVKDHLAALTVDVNQEAVPRVRDPKISSDPGCRLSDMKKGYGSLRLCRLAWRYGCGGRWEYEWVARDWRPRIPRRIRPRIPRPPEPSLERYCRICSHFQMHPFDCRSCRGQFHWPGPQRVYSAGWLFFSCPTLLFLVCCLARWSLCRFTSVSSFHSRPSFFYYSQQTVGFLCAAFRGTDPFELDKSPIFRTMDRTAPS